MFDYLLLGFNCLSLLLLAMKTLIINNKIMTNTALIMIPINIPPIHEIAPFDDDDATVALAIIKYTITRPFYIL